MDKLLELFAEVLKVDASSLDDQSSPDNVAEWDSLAAMLLVSAIEERYHIQLSTKEIMKMVSIGLARKALHARQVDV